MKLEEVILYFLEQQIPFVSFRLPDDGNVTTWQGDCVRHKELISITEALPAFVMHPFENNSEKGILALIPTWKADGYEVSSQLPVHQQIAHRKLLPVKPYTVSEQEYMDGFSTLIRAINRQEVSKVVYSRVLPAVRNISPGKLYFKLLEKYPKAFVYLFSDGQGCCYTGASPEKLLITSKNAAETVSLAGTRKLMSDENPENPWTDKEYQEQAIVTEMIAKTLANSGITEVTTLGPSAHHAGPVMHLITTFTFSIPESIDHVNLAEALHPTPAVCGTPTYEAFQLIKRTEKHQRDYYTGFLGPVLDKQKMNLFVNLRCARFVDNECFIYVGGGITRGSDGAAEWKETENKAATLLNLFES